MLIATDPIDLLEKRVADLELKLLPKDRTREIDKSQVITDLLLQTHSMISTALSCRDVISTVLDKLTTINDYLDPNFAERISEVEEKRQYIITVYPQLKNYADLIKDFKNLWQYIDSKNIHNITELTDKLQKLAIENINVYEESKIITTQILESLVKYNDILLSIRLLFAQLEANISAAEQSVKPKEFVDE